jgi:leader peptidase (prepilin peptidase)/N-methyltransferase
VTGWEVGALLVAPAVGSFAGLLADRMPEGRPVVAGRSTCDGCGRALRPAALIPLLSFALQRGRARCCGAALRPFLPAVEVGAAAVAVWAAAATDGPLALATALLGWGLLALALIDARCMRLPDALTLPLAAAGLAVAAAGMTGPLALHAAGAAAGWAILRLSALVWLRLRGVEGMGAGDAKLLGAGGAWLGLAGLPSALLWACGFGLLWAVVAARGAAPGWRDAIPFGPALAAGIWLTWTLGPIGFGGPT